MGNALPRTPGPGDTELPPVHGLSSAIVPHRRWWQRTWFQAIGGTRYYHRPGFRRAFAPGERFYEGVDPDLRELCKALVERGLRTAPSCQGHFHDRAYFEQRWDELRHEADAITRDGLVVLDAQSSRRHLFRDRHYSVAWGTFEAFFRQSLRHQSTGYLGVFVPRHELSVYRRLRRLATRQSIAAFTFDRRAERIARAHLLHILVHPRDEQDGERRWRWLTERIIDAVDDARKDANSAPEA